MKYTLLLALTCIALLGPAGCASRRGDLELDKVQIPGSAPGKGGVTDIGSAGGVYEDDFLQITWTWGKSALKSSLKFDMLNKTGNTMQVIWDDAAIVTSDGETHRVYHEDVRFFERTSVFPPTSIPAGARLAEAITPLDYVTVTDTIGISAKPLFRRNAGPMSLQVLLPVTINGSRQEYRFFLEWIAAG